MTEFTGERVIPGQVNDDLWAEHFARYAFAARFAAGKRVLDLGCGTGYGTAELAKTAREATGVDVAPDAVAYASEHYPGVTYLTAGADKLPFTTASFELVTCFELIEHLDDWRAMLAEVRRVLAAAGILIVSTPNKLYYAETRGVAGPNPYHRHEFEYSEFGDVLREMFPHVQILLQDRMEAFGFYDPSGSEGTDGHIARSSGAAESANFFVALCSKEALPETPGFVFVPQAANLLRERETHISKLQEELGQVRQWLTDAMQERDRMLELHRSIEADLAKKNQWAADLQANLKASQERVVELQDRTAEREREIAIEKQRAIEILTRLEATVVERSEWAKASDRQAQALTSQVQALTSESQALTSQIAGQSAQLAMVRESRWVKLGRMMGLGPKIAE